MKLKMGMLFNKRLVLSLKIWNFVAVGRCVPFGLNLLLGLVSMYILTTHTTCASYLYDAADDTLFVKIHHRQMHHIFVFMLKPCP